MIFIIIGCAKEGVIADDLFDGVVLSTDPILVTIEPHREILFADIVRLYS